MQYRNMYQKICAMCGKQFEHGRSNKECCSPECTYKKKLQRYREYNKRLSEELKDKPQAEKPRNASNVESIAEFNAKARAAGMSYGQYDLAIRLGRAANG